MPGNNASVQAPVNEETAKWRKILKYGDTLLKGNSSDTVILVTGPPDCGKTTFIEALTDEPKGSPVVSLHSRSKKIEHQIIKSTVSASDGINERLIVAEIPSFDDTLEGDRELLREISAWLANCYSSGIKFGGAIYLHDISLPRLNNSVRRNLDLFRSICGQVGLSAVILTTTKWDSIEKAIAEKREEQLKDGLWKDMIAARSSVRKFDGSSESAWKIINKIIAKKEQTHSPNALRIQKEVVDHLLRLPETHAGQLLYSMLIEMRKLYRDRIRSWELQFRDEEMRSEVQVFKDYESRLNDDIRALEIGVMGRLRLFMAGSSKHH